MADEATCIETPTIFRRYTVADGNTIPIGTMLRLTTPNTAVAHSGDAQVFAGIAWEEKTADDGITEITAALNGVWDITDGGAGFTVGAILALDGTANEVRPAIAAELLTGAALGKALETAAGDGVARVAIGQMI